MNGSTRIQLEEAMLEFTDIQKLDTGVVTPRDVVKRALQLRYAVNSSPTAFVDCARAFVSFGMLREALATYSEAISRDGEYVEAFLGRAQVGYGLVLSSEDDDSAEEIGSEVASDFRRVLEITGGKSREAVLGLGSALLAMNKFAECANWIEEQLRDCGDKNYEGDLLYLFALCRLFAGDVDQARDYAKKMDRVAGFDAERLFICGFVSWLRGDRDELLEYRAALQLRDAKLAQVLGAIEAGAKSDTFLDLARLLL